MLVREEKESAEEWLGNLRVNVNEWEYKEKDKRLKEQFFDGIKDDMVIEIIKELTAIKLKFNKWSGVKLG